MNRKRQPRRLDSKLSTAFALVLAVLNNCAPAEADDDDDEGVGGTTASGGSTAAGGSRASGSGGSAGDETTDPSGGSAGSESGGSSGEGPGPDTGGSDASGGTPGTGGSGGTEATGGTSTGGSGGAGGPDDIDHPGRGSTGPLIIQVTSATGPAVPGERLVYKITVGNTSDAEVDGVSVQLRVPEGLQFTGTTHAEPDPTGCWDTNCSADEEANWEIGTLPAQSTRTITVNPEVLATMEEGDEIAATVRLSATDLSPVTVTNTLSVYTTPAAQLSLGTVTDPGTPGENVELALDVGHIGPEALTNAQLTAYLHPGLAITSISDDGAEVAPGKVVWPVDAFDVGASLHRTVKVEIDPAVAPGNVLLANAEFSHDGGLAVDHAVELPLSVVSEQQPLRFALALAANPALPSGRLSYTATVTNTGTRDIEDVSVLLRMPAALQFTATTHAHPDPTSCWDPACSAAEEATWSLGTLPAGSSQTISVNPEVLAATVTDGTVISTHWSVWGAGVNPINALQAVPVQSEPEAELALGAVRSVLTPNETVTFDLDVGQIGGADLTASSLKLYLPPGLTVTEVSGDGTETATGEVSWDLGTLGVAESLEHSATLATGSHLVAGEVLTARAVLTYAGGAERDAVSEYSIVIGDALPLSMTVTATPDPVTPGERVLYTTTVTNTSARAVEGVNLLMRLPRGLQFTATTHADPDATSCWDSACTPGEEADWSIGTLAAGGSQIVTVNPEVLAPLFGGNLITTTQRLTATNLAATVNSQTTVAVGD